MTQAHGKTLRGGAAPGGGRCGGFTLIEVITVLMIIGILSALIVSRASLSSSDLNARLSEVRAQLRSLQLTAMKNGTTYLVMRCDGADYWTFNSASPSTRLLLPGETSGLVSLADKKMTMTSFIISFDANGIPYTGDPQVKLANNATITITAAGQSGSLTVVPETGFVR